MYCPLGVGKWHNKCQPVLLCHFRKRSYKLERVYLMMYAHWFVSFCFMLILSSVRCVLSWVENPSQIAKFMGPSWGPMNLALRDIAHAFWQELGQLYDHPVLVKWPWPRWVILTNKEKFGLCSAIWQTLQMKTVVLLYVLKFVLNFYFISWTQ